MVVLGKVFLKGRRNLNWSLKDWQAVGALGEGRRCAGLVKRK